MDFSLLFILLLLFLAAALYSSVGHAGASGYIAVMAFMSIAPEQIRPAALVLNVLVAMLTTYKFLKVGAFNKQLFFSLSVTSVPAAYIAGSLYLPGHIYKIIVGAVLIFSAIKIFFTAKKNQDYLIQKVPVPVLLIIGAALGFLSGLTGVGGGVFLSPLLLFFHWAKIKAISGIAAAFILVNSIAALSGIMQSNPKLPENLFLWVVAAFLGGYIGAEFGSKRLGNPMIQRILAFVLIIAGAKMIATA